MNIRVNLDPGQVLKSRGLGSSKEAQKLLATQFERLCQPYVPMSAGSGAHMVNLASIAEDGSTVTWPGPYAHYQYVGEVYGPNIPLSHGGVPSGYFSPPGQPKSPTGRGMEYHGAPMRGKEWDKRMMADRGKELVEAVAKFVGGKAT